MDVACWPCRKRKGKVRFQLAYLITSSSLLMRGCSAAAIGRFVLRVYDEASNVRMSTMKG